VKVANYVADFIAMMGSHGTARNRVYTVCGAGAMHLNDAICHHQGIEVIAMHHEQAAAYAAEADARVTNRPAVVHVTAGPGGSNTLTGIACAYVDSIPMIVIAGQVTSTTMARTPGLRQRGMNELDMVALAQPITKNARTVTEPFLIRYCLEKALHAATSGRPGPVFLEIPLDVQSAEIDPDHLSGFEGQETDSLDYIKQFADRAVAMLAQSQRPLMMVGNGVRLSDARLLFRKLAMRLGIPVISSWNASDILDNSSGLYLGRCGLFGDRASNMAVQSADLILAIGTRLSVAQIGHAPEKFAPQAKKIVVDIDGEELDKLRPAIDLPIIADAGPFMAALLARLPEKPDMQRIGAWWNKLADAPKAYAYNAARQPVLGDGIDAYWFVKALERQLDPNAIVITDVGFSFIPAMQTLTVHEGQRLFHSSGVSPMGWALPAAIGACLAAPGRQIICLIGDGGLMMNLQELATIAARRLPISIFVFDNDGYATMRIAQRTHFGRDSVSGPDSGLEIPSIALIAEQFGLRVMDFNTQDSVEKRLPVMLEAGHRAPAMMVLGMAPDQVLSPRVQARVEGGKFLPTDIADMWPYLDRKEFARAMA
jgi:acetolactate synthase-1/2/3 large subunit